MSSVRRSIVTEHQVAQLVFELRMPLRRYPLEKRRIGAHARTTDQVIDDVDARTRAPRDSGNCRVSAAACDVQNVLPGSNAAILAQDFPGNRVGHADDMKIADAPR